MIPGFVVVISDIFITDPLERAYQVRPMRASIDFPRQESVCYDNEVDMREGKDSSGESFKVRLCPSDEVTGNCRPETSTPWQGH